jgi:hypothetical protein
MGSRIFWRNEQFDASGDAWLAADEAGSFEVEDHLVDRRWADAEVLLHVGLGLRRRGAGKDRQETGDCDHDNAPADHAHTSLNAAFVGVARLTAESQV